MRRSTTRRAVYTAQIGGSEPPGLWDAPAGEDVDYIFFADRPVDRGARWNVVVVRPRYADDTVRSARYLKIIGHPALDDYDEVMWLDNRVELRSTPEPLFAMLAGHDVALPSHGFRRSLREEFAAVLAEHRDDPIRVRRQLAMYRAHLPSVLDARPLWTGIVVRRNTPAARDFQRRWMDEVLRHSRRDQLSILAALGASEARWIAFDLDNLSSPYHLWLSELDAGRDRSQHRWQSAHQDLTLKAWLDAKLYSGSAARAARRARDLARSRGEVQRSNAADDV